MTAHRPADETILVVDDEPMIRQLMRRTLEARGYRVLEAPDGPEALSCAAAYHGPIDLLVSDIVMPEMDGFALSEQLVGSHPEAQILFITGQAERLVGAPKAFEDTERSYLLKPFSQDHLVQTVRQRLDERPVRSARRDAGPTPAAAAERVVRVRINVSGERLIGHVNLEDRLATRLSDVLNDAAPYLSVLPVTDTPGEGAGETMAIRKSAISYIEALEEPHSEGIVPLGSFRLVTVEFSPRVNRLRGELFVAANASVMDVLQDGRPFLKLRRVHILDSVEAYDFLAVGKRQARLIRV